MSHDTLAGPASRVWRPYGIPRWLNAGGGLISTVADLLRFAGGHMQGTAPNPAPILRHEIAHLMQTPVVEASWAPHWGLGWELSSAGGVRIVAHGGATHGFRCRLVLIPERRFAVAILTNGSSGETVNRRIERWALERFLGLQVDDPPPVAMSPEQLQRVVGRYQSRFSPYCPAFDISVVSTAGGISLSWMHQDPTDTNTTRVDDQRAEALGGLRFRFSTGAYAGTAFDFIPGEDDAIRFLRIGSLAEKIA